MIPTNKVRFSHIRTELGFSSTTPLNYSTIFDESVINMDGISSEYCDGGTAALRLQNLCTPPYQIGKLRGYRHGIVYLFVSPNRLYAYDHDQNALTEVGLYHYGSSDIAMTDNRVWFLYGANPVNLAEYFFDLRYPDTLNFSRSFTLPLNNAAGLHAISNNVLIIGGSGSIKVYSIAQLPATEINSIPITEMVSGDIVYLPLSGVVLATITQLSGFDVLRKYNYTGGLIASNQLSFQCFTMYLWRSKVYCVSISGGLYEVNPENLQVTYIRQLTGLGGTVNGACSTHFRNMHI